MENQSKVRSFLKSEAGRYVVKIVLVYVVWKVAHYFLLSPGRTLADWWTGVVTFIGAQYAVVTNGILKMFGEHSQQGYKQIQAAVYFPERYRIVYVVEHCLAIPATIIFVSAIAMYRGSWKNKLWFIPMGILAIVVINLIRLVLLCFTFIHFSKTFYDVNHSVIYVIVTYALIMLLIAWWMRKFGNQPAGAK
jgi:exosortase/archaeosortase family protein